MSRSSPRVPAVGWAAVRLLLVLTVVAGLLSSGFGGVRAAGAASFVAFAAGLPPLGPEDSATRRAPGAGGQTFYRYMTAAELEAVRETGLLRGGRAGETFWTTDEFTSASDAQDQLALPSRPELRVRFHILNTPTLTRNGSIVEPAFGGRGGAHEYASFDPVAVEIIDVQPLT